ncbi:uncharacterized protein LOC133840693 isoform X2 [Drosophila sulfurigaster albostrigata]|uniref:uncharacterized protein LOC133840693 isoform X2 n=1 Tax=Drosophila sulfurigaster albostrigata TaxID=89887 RepID=UPI002D21D886|nr:uncharacterized protein LOC133840693 isoform X2 [Drosophila sulfurigaster albostrigata]
MPECEVFGMMSSQDLLEEQRNINERLGSLERKVDFLINLHVDKLCEDAKEVVEPTEFPIKSTGDEEEDESYENPEYKTTSKKRSIEKSTPTPAKRAMTPKEDSATCDEGEDESYENPEYKTTSKKRSIEKSTPKPAKRVMVEKEKSPPALEDADEFEVDRFEDSSPMDFVKANLDILEDDYEPEMSAELEELTVDFPIKDKSQLEAVEKKISSNREKYVRLFKFYLKSGSFEENCASFFDGSLAVDMSYDGLGSKTAFSNYVHFNIALFESQKSDEFTYEDYKKTVRSGFLKYKKWKRNDRKK